MSGSLAEAMRSGVAPARSRTVAVVYDYGSLAPMRLAEVAAEVDANVVFVKTGSDHARQMAGVLEVFGDVVEAAGVPLEQVANLVAAYSPDGIVTFSELQIGYTADLAELLGLRNVAPACVPAIVRKDFQRRALADAGVEHVRFDVVSSLSDLDQAFDLLALPLIIKPLVGVASRNTVIGRTREECRAVVSMLLEGSDGAPRVEKELIVEEFLVGRECEWQWGDYMAVDSLVLEGVVHPLFATGKLSLAPPFRERGCYIPPHEDASEVDAVKRLAARAVKAVGITSGIADVEIKLTIDGPRIIEVNGRLGGWVDDVAVRSGASSPAVLAMKTALGIPIDVGALRTSDTIAYYYLAIPPLEAKRVASIDEIQALRGLEHVDQVTPMVQPGSDVDWRKGTASGAAAITGCVPSYDALRETIESIDATNWISYAY